MSAAASEEGGWMDPQPRCPRITVGADLTGAWADGLVAAGFAAERRSVFVAEGLLGYLEEPDVHRFLYTHRRRAVKPESAAPPGAPSHLAM
jgi:O-methyltransferase involved in polyketide biosynthesis